MNYYIKLRERAYGPFTAEKIRSMIQQGNIDASSPLSTDKRTWREAGSFAEFFDQPAPAAEPQPAASAASQSTASSLPQPGAYSAPQAPTSSAPCWFLSLDGQTGSGPYAAAALYEAVQNGQANADSLVWRNGENARPMREEPEFAHLFGQQQLGVAYQSGVASRSHYDYAQEPATRNLADQLARRFRAYWVSCLLLFVLPFIGFLLCAFVVTVTENTDTTTTETLWSDETGAKRIEIVREDKDLVAALFALNTFAGVIAFSFCIVAPLVCSTIAGIFLLMFVHAFWRALPPENAPTTPGPACGLLLIPIFNIYWNFVVFYQGTSYANRCLKSVAPHVAQRTQVSETLALLYAIGLIVCSPVAFFLTFPLCAQMRNVGVELVKAR
ncbi:MAG: DUF4339 domain-containing protein [Thermoguttaceae bacterium]|nr:DUF4339 domain-containing protein [Thermoguttaceae bacterium]